MPSALAVSGELQWLDQFGASANEYRRATNVALDHQGDIFAAGELWNSGDGFLVSTTAAVTKRGPT